ncbi:MAG: hypothetical protein JKY56_12975 [Kofleriaceae bacterium]|nr:hypothetical protein [Kofleriaceae bacterium]
MPGREKVEIVDASFRWDTPWHVFKTEVYASTLRLLFPSHWTIDALDYRSRDKFRGTGTPPADRITTGE